MMIFLHSNWVAGGRSGGYTYYSIRVCVPFTYPFWLKHYSAIEQIHATTFADRFLCVVIGWRGEGGDVWFH